MKRFGQSRFVTVWLVLLGILCGMAVPTIATARVHREISTEGDPGDGFGYAGGGSGFLTEPDQSGTVAKVPESPQLVKIVVEIVDGEVVIRVELLKMERAK